MTPKEAEEIGGIKELLDRIRTDEAWQALWQHVLVARQDALLRMAAAENWDQHQMIRGELNAINIILEWGDDLAARLEEAVRNVEVDNGRFGRYQA